jgi:hypothetical protein
MARPKTTVRGRAPLARDSEQWMLDYLTCHRSARRHLL